MVCFCALSQIQPGVTKARQEPQSSAARAKRSSPPGVPKTQGSQAAPLLRSLGWQRAVFAFWGGVVKPSERQRATAERWVKVKGNKSPGQGATQKDELNPQGTLSSSPTRRVILRTRRYHSPSGAKPPPAMNLQVSWRVRRICSAAIWREPRTSFPANCHLPIANCSWGGKAFNQSPFFTKKRIPRCRRPVCEFNV